MTELEYTLHEVDYALNVCLMAFFTQEKQNKYNYWKAK